MTGTVKQQRYDPFANKRRAQSEELGEYCRGPVLAARSRRHPRKRRPEVLEGFPQSPHRVLGETIKRAATLDWEARNKVRLTSALKAARRRSRRITPEFCLKYLDAWRNDGQTWQKHLGAFSEYNQATSPESGTAVRQRIEVLRRNLGLEGCSTHVAATASGLRCHSMRRSEPRSCREFLYAGSRRYFERTKHVSG